MAKPKTSSDFGEFQARPAAVVDVVDPAKYAGMAPAEAARIAIEDYHARRPLRETTRKEKRYILQRTLETLAQKGRDLSNVEQATLRVYADWLQVQVDEGAIKENYAYNIAKEWNSLVGVLFGDKKRPGEGLRMKTSFRQSPRQCEILAVEEIDAMIQAIPLRRWMGDLNRGAVHTYLEVAQATAGRSKSILSVEATFGDIDYTTGTLRYRDVKNLEEGEFLQVVLTERCMARLRAWEAELRQAGRWEGLSTPIMTAERGILTYQGLMKALKDLAVLGEVSKPVSTHVLRKSTGTHMARHDPKLARQQLGITQKVFDRHYDQPDLQMRIERRDIIPGAEPTYPSVEARMGTLTRKLRLGQISQQEWEREIQRLELQEGLRPASKGFDPSVA